MAVAVAVAVFVGVAVAVAVLVGVGVAHALTAKVPVPVPELKAPLAWTVKLVVAAGVVPQVVWMLSVVFPPVPQVVAELGRKTPSRRRAAL